jgi:hypothetical protein
MLKALFVILYHVHLAGRKIAVFSTAFESKGAAAAAILAGKRGGPPFL